VGTLEIPGATEDTVKIAVDGQTIRVEAEGPLRKYRKELQASFKPDPKKVTCHLANGICELKAEKV
jgi:HSP20 family molecular chaperone IbpA